MRARSILVDLLRLRLATQLRLFREFFSAYTVQCFIYAVLILAFWAFCMASVFLTVRYVNRELTFIGPFLLDRMLSIFLLAIFIMLVYTNLLTAFSILFASEDLPLLLSSPTPSAEVFRTKMWESLFLGSWTYLAFGMPIFVAYGACTRSPVYYYAMVLVGMVPFAVLAGLAGVACSMFLARFNRRRRLRLAGLLFWILIGLLVYSLRDVIAAAPRHQNEAADRLVQWEHSRSIYLPHSWFFNLVKESMAGRAGDAAMYLMLLTAAAITGSGVTAWIGGLLYQRAWQSGQECNDDARVSRPGLFFSCLLLPARCLRRSAQSVVVKDVRLFFRDVTQWGQMMVVLALLVLYILQLSALPMQERRINVNNVMVMLNQSVLGFVICALCIRFVFPSLSLEGRAIWTLASSTVSLRQLFRIKWRFHLAWVCLLALLLLVPAWYFLEIPPALLAVVAAQLLLLSVGSVSLSMGVAALYPRFYAKNAAEINSGTGAMVCIILTLSYLSLTTVCFLSPLVPARGLPDLLRGALDQPAYTVICWTLALLLHAAAIAVPFFIGQRRLESTPL